jgi:hypothetical protein
VKEPALNTKTVRKWSRKDDKSGACRALVFWFAEEMQSKDDKSGVWLVLVLKVSAIAAGKDPEKWPKRRQIRGLVGLGSESIRNSGWKGSQRDQKDDKSGACWTSLFPMCMILIVFNLTAFQNC